MWVLRARCAMAMSPRYGTYTRHVQYRELRHRPYVMNLVSWTTTFLYEGENAPWTAPRLCPLHYYEFMMALNYATWTIPRICSYILV